MVPEFHVSQRGESRSVLELIQDSLGCGYLKPNHAKNARDTTWVFVVKAAEDLKANVIPFFQEFSLRTQKKHDFEKFTEIVIGLANREHITKEGFERLLRLAFSMNSNGVYRKLKVENIISNLKPSETICQTS